ncbi:MULTISPECIES: hypothetical protein [Alkalihalophilus]|uniref:Uncharacterized protein n=1 Tax=Alkalihalophilus pseudofirmus (strain ATCC BAA-2126 / JCM 17055 / OF4) TaxID=398511 RepID=D3FRJ0_ALKPO|nr:MULTISPECIES: hypothetical protein [Alkalihalophilus]ADC51581.1 hypothetical protein BpOF4_17700 [Alkalihalophilus pseudofirmus OF4]MEC2072590.1 hypothetical protein [Alkalihalophilus marmarensis]
MNNKFILLIIVLCLVSGCKNEVNTSQFSYPQLLPAEDGKYSYVVIYPNEHTEHRIPEFMRGYEQNSNLTLGTMMSLENFNLEYSELAIGEAPYYVFLDTNGIVFETSDEREAGEFYLENIHLN